MPPTINGPEHKKLLIGRNAAGFVSDERPLTATEKRDNWIVSGYHIEKVWIAAKVVETERLILSSFAFLSVILFFSASFGYTLYGEIHFFIMVFLGLRSGSLIVSIRKRVVQIHKMNEYFFKEFGFEIYSIIREIENEPNLAKLILSSSSKVYWTKGPYTKVFGIFNILRWTLLVFIPVALGVTALVGAFFTGENYWYNAIGLLIYTNP